MTAQLDHVNGRPITAEPRFDPIALAKAEAIRTQAEAEAKALCIKAEGEAKAAEATAREEAEKQRILNERAAMKLEADRAIQAERVAKAMASAASSEAAAAKTKRLADAEIEDEYTREREEQRTEATWKWSARGIYLTSLIIALPLQLKAFYSDDKPFMVAAPVLLEGLALVLAFGGAWAIAHRRDVLPYRIGIMAAALIAAGVNLWHGNTDPSIGIEAGIVGALASLGGPVVLMAYEHGIAQKRDGIPSYRERRDAKKAAAKAAREAAEAAREKQSAEESRRTDRERAEARAAAEQKRKDADRQSAHPKVWDVAEAMRSARGLEFVTDQIWSEAWHRVTGSKIVGIWPELEASSKAAAAEMKAASEGTLSHVESQMPPSREKAAEALDGRRFNGGTPPRRVPNDTPPYSIAARTVASLAALQNPASEEQS
ncbi:hypothetical protein AB0M92_18990 [Streptomyces sp. NPDC051582]|uniref:hypothetical protein n=1 Tax=Streptomyces sp. NPDC051582 TaxID=3155167 RepID=UPI00341FAA5E